MTRPANLIGLLLTLAFGAAAGCSSNGGNGGGVGGGVGGGNVPGVAKIFDVRTEGAAGDGATDDTAAFQQALTRCAERGGGEVIVPAGNYLIGSVVLGSKTTLRFEPGVTITGKADPQAYPVRQIRWEGRWRDGHRALFHAENARDVAIVGPATINGAIKLGYLRRPRGPCIIEFIECTGVRLEGFSINYERMWAVHPTYCRDVTIDGLTIRSKRDNGDGIDVDSCANVRITNCDIDAGDDAIALKSGRGQEGVRVARPTENVYIADCKLGSAFAGLAIGTEMSGGVRNVKFERCTFTRGSNSIFIKSRVGRGGFIDNIEGRDIEAKASAFLRIDLLTKGIQDEQPVEGLAGLPVARNFRFENVTAHNVPFLVDAALIPPERPLEGLKLIKIKGTCGKAIELGNIRDVELRDIDVKPQREPVLRAVNVTGRGIENATPLQQRHRDDAERGVDRAGDDVTDHAQDNPAMMRSLVAIAVAVALITVADVLAAPAPTTARALLLENVDRPLRYRPDGHDFVITNGPEFFNRPLYGSNTAFRVDAGDRPEFSLYLPGRGGNLRLAIGRKWLHDAATVETRYRPGSMLYEIRDPDIAGAVKVAVLGMRQTEGVILRVTLADSREPVELVTAYGGANGARGRRDGDIGTESQPVSRYFQLRPEFCQGNAFAIDGGRFTMTSKAAVIAGISSAAAAKFDIADAAHWNDLPKLLERDAQATGETERPVVVGRMTLRPDEPLYFALQRLPKPGDATATRPSAVGLIEQPYATEELKRIFDDAERERQAIATKIVVDTPDPHVNAAAAALCVAADGTWDARQTAVMHGAVAWRSRLLGWRGVYWCDALGYHERTRQHLSNWLPRQNDDPIPPALPPAATADNLSRNEPALHTSGDLTRSHYDMNMVAIDALFRHLLWTGDVEYARQVWPNIERHLAWERRLFRRNFGEGDDALPLYEGYANFWASDAVGYNGGGVAHASAMNLYHHRMAARVARLIGVDPTPYEREAELILAGMRRHLWLGRKGWFAEWKDLLGLQLVHDNAALWTFYHVIDAGAATPLEAWQMSRFVDTQLAHIPVGGGGGEEYVLPTTSWMPPIWSTNNVVVAESAHAALAMWQAGRDDEAFHLFKGNLLATMYSGLCPGNVGMCTQFDVLRGEAQRDFADGVGATSRALVEGLFGVRPDALAGEILFRPGFPAQWNNASLKHPSVDVSFARDGERENFRVGFRGKPMRLRLQVPALCDDVTGVQVNGRPASWKSLEDEIGRPRIEIVADAAQQHDVRIAWAGSPPAAPPNPLIAGRGERFSAKLADAEPVEPIEILDPQDALAELEFVADSVRAVASGEFGHRTFFVKLKQRRLTWWMPVPLEIRPPIEVIPHEPQPPGQLAFVIRNHTDAQLDGRVESRDLSIPPRASSDTIVLTRGIVPGTNRLEIDFGPRGKVAGHVTNWRVDRPPASPASLEPVDLTPHFNDRVTQIFRNDYLAPRSPHVSLAVPRHGYSNWCKPTETFEVDDSGMRRAADASGGKIVLPPGIPLATPGAGSGDRGGDRDKGGAKNVLFTSRWENYPAEASVPLTGRASHVYLLMAGSTFSTLSRFDNGEVLVTYADGAAERLALRNPTTWWPIDQDFLIDGFAFRRLEAIPPRVDLRTGEIRVTTLAEFKGRGGRLPGGAATILDLPLDPTKELKSLTVRALANEVVIGLMSATLAREERARG